MTTNITPDAIRAAADLIDELFTADTRVLSVDLRLVADLKERELAAEKRVNDALAVWHDARANSSAVGVEFDRVGMRAVLAHLEREHNTDDVDQDTARKSYQWDTLADVPDHITEVYRPTAGSTIFKRRDGEWFKQCGPRPDVRVSAGLIGPFEATPF